MTDAPKRIWYEDPRGGGYEYVRADLYYEVLKIALEECPFREDTASYFDWWHERKAKLLTMTTEKG